MGHFSCHFGYGAIAVLALQTAVLLWTSKYSVKRMFKTAPNRERLFYLRGEPYIVPDSATSVTSIGKQHGSRASG
jgi:hypothetical protein